MAGSSFAPTGETDDDLLILMSWKDDDPDAARAALGEFYNRHVKYVHDRCAWAYASDIGEAGVEDLVQDMFWRAFERAGTYEPQPARNADHARHALRAWLGQIAHRLFLDARRREERTFELVTRETDRIRDIPSREGVLRNLTPREELLELGMHEALDARERDILTIFATYYDANREHQRSPEGIVEELCRRWNLLPENVRQIRKRALAKLRRYVESQESIKEERTGVNVAVQGQ